MSRRALFGFVFLFLILGVLALAQVPDIGGRIVFASDRDGSPNLWILDLETNETKKLTDFPGVLSITDVVYPHWSNDGKRILFSGRTPNNWYQIYLINDDGTQLKSITNYPGFAQFSAWDPTDNTFCYCLQAISWGNELIHKVNLTTREDIIIPISPDQVENQSSGHDGFAITPDGSKILFSRNYFYQSSYLGYQDMLGNLLQIIARDLPRTGPLEVNSVDGWILFEQATSFPATGTYNVGKMDKNGLNKIMLTAGPVGERYDYPCWTRGGNDNYILFFCNKYGNNEIVAMKADGASYPNGLVNLTNNPAQDLYPNWSPIGSYALVFEGFFPPVENPPTVNKANAGQTIPVKWRVTDKTGVPISDPASFVSITSYSISCTTFSGDPTNEVQEFAAGSSGLQYQGDGWWQFNWKTSKLYKGQCRTMKVTLDDKSEHTANFSFK